MALARNPSYLKRQKEQKRAAKAARKRQERSERKQAKAEGGGGGEEFGSLADLGIGPEAAEPGTEGTAQDSPDDESEKPE